MPSKKELLAGGIYAGIIIIWILAIAEFHKARSNVLPILEYPAPILREVAAPVGGIDDATVSLAGDMISTLRYRTLVDFFLSRSVPRGLAAPQVGISKRLVVCGINGGATVMVNPEIVEKKGTYLDRDGCLSVPEGGKRHVRRSAHIKVRYFTLDNREKMLVARNDDAALIEHEIDHLNGVLNLDHVY